MTAIEIFKYFFMGTFGIVFGILLAVLVFYFLLNLFGFYIK